MIRKAFECAREESKLCIIPIDLITYFQKVLLTSSIKLLGVVLIIRYVNWLIFNNSTPLKSEKLAYILIKSQNAYLPFEAYDK